MFRNSRFFRYGVLSPKIAIALSVFVSFGVAASENTPEKATLTKVAQNLTSPIFVTSAPGDSKLFIVQQNGIVSILQDGVVRDVLNIIDRVTHAGEAGLLGLALHPDFSENGLAYVSYTTGSLTSVIDEFRYDNTTGEFDTASRREIYSIAQPARNHNGGMVAFGPDGYLYIGFGDGGGANDTYANGQNFDTALGSIVRIAVGPGTSGPYDIPDDNPALDGPAPEAWIYGVRNPWRFSFDGDQLYIGDVGQSGEEEIHVVAAGKAASGLNLGWPLAEGNTCVADAACRIKDLDWPVLTYPTANGCAVTGGYVYRGENFPTLTGHYFYGDFCTGEISSFLLEDGVATKQRSWASTLGRVEFLSSFGIGGFGELYAVSLTGSIFRLDPE